MNKIYFLFYNNNGDIMKLKDIMSRNIIVANINDDIVTISNVMKKYDVGFLILVDDDKSVGCITDRDLVVKTISNNDYRVDDYVSSIISVSIDDSIESVLKIMKDNKIKRVVVQDNKRIVGVISISDLFDYVSDEDLINTIKTIFKIEVHPKFDTDIGDFYL